LEIFNFKWTYFYEVTLPKYQRCSQNHGAANAASSGDQRNSRRWQWLIMRWFFISNSKSRAFPVAAVSRVALNGKMLMVGVKDISERQRCSWKQL